MEKELFNEVRRTFKNWWISLIIGILAIVIGVWSMFTPDTTLVALTFLFVAGLFVGGILEIVFAIQNRKIMEGWGWSLAAGILDILIGTALLLLPLPIMTVALIYFVGFWIMFRSIMTIGSSIDLKNYGVKGWGWILALGIISVLLSFVFLLSPLFGGLFVIALFAVAMIFYGILRIYMAFVLRSIHKDLKRM